MIYATTLVFPLIAFVAGVTILVALAKFIRDMQRDFKATRPTTKS